MSEFVRVAGTADLKPGSGMVAEVNGKSIAVFNVEGTYHAIDNTCIHRGGPLGEGDVEGQVVTCPWHGWSYDLRTGILVQDGKMRVSCHLTRLVGDVVQVRLS